MEEMEHQVPKFDMEPQVNIPFIAFAVPRRVALATVVVIVASIMLVNQGVSLHIVIAWILPIQISLAAAYILIRPEKLSVDRWIIILWEYFILPKYLPWIPGAGQTKKPADRRRSSASASVRDLWGQQP